MMAEKAEKFLIPLDEYLKVGVHIGTKSKTKFMEPFIYKIRPDGLPVLNVQEIDKRLKLLANILTMYNAEDIFVVCRRENGWKAVRKFSELTGIKNITSRYPPGILTNPGLDDFIEAKILFVIDPWPDRNAVKDATRCGIPVVALCDTNNDAKDIDHIVPCNNKGKKSLALIMWVLAKEFLISKGVIKKDSDMKLKVEDFVQE